MRNDDTQDPEKPERENATDAQSAWTPLPSRRRLRGRTGLFKERRVEPSDEGDPQQGEPD